MRDDETTRAALAARAGDEVAAASFVRATQRDVWLLLAYLVSRQEASDLAQETYLRAFRALPRFRGEATARTLLLAIARRVAADHLRSRGRQPAIDREAELGGSTDPRAMILPTRWYYDGLSPA